jgi:hypothetical protein
MADITKRVSYFDRQFLRATDFQAEQAYELDRRRRHNRLLHQPGVAEGLQVTANPNDTVVSVSPGTAYDQQGQEIVLSASQHVDISTITGATTNAFVTIAYAEQPTDPSTDPGVTGNSMRVTEQPALAASATMPANPNLTLLLAKVALVNSKVSGTPDNSVRSQAGTTMSPDATLTSLTLRNAAVQASGWPKFACKALNSAALQNASLTMDTSSEVFFTDAGQIRSFDDNHRIVFNRTNNLLELHELGDIVLMTGGAPPAEKMRVTAAGRIGIGTALPDANLTVQGSGGSFLTVRDIESSGTLEVRLGADSSGVSVGTLTATDLQLRTGNNPQLVVKADGNVGIGIPTTVEPAGKLDVAGTVHASSFPTSSDQRFKKNVTPITDALNRVERIRGVTFDWNEEYQLLGRSTGRREVGVVAQDVERACPELVSTWNKGDYKAVDYGRMSALLVEAVKELAAQNRRLEDRVKVLEGDAVRTADHAAVEGVEPKQKSGRKEKTP